jgi:hypothetical protein
MEESATVVRWAKDSFENPVMVRSSDGFTRGDYRLGRDIWQAILAHAHIKAAQRVKLSLCLLRAGAAATEHGACDCEESVFAEETEFTSPRQLPTHRPVFVDDDYELLCSSSARHGAASFWDATTTTGNASLSESFWFATFA